jgi:hypothetical protein
MIYGLRFSSSGVTYIRFDNYYVNPIWKPTIIEMAEAVAAVQPYFGTRKQFESLIKCVEKVTAMTKKIKEEIENKGPQTLKTISEMMPTPRTLVTTCSHRVQPPRGPSAPYSCSHRPAQTELLTPRCNIFINSSDYGCS